MYPVTAKSRPEARPQPADGKEGKEIIHGTPIGEEQVADTVWRGIESTDDRYRTPGQQQDQKSAHGRWGQQNVFAPNTPSKPDQENIDQGAQRVGEQTPYVGGIVGKRIIDTPDSQQEQ